MKKVLAIVMCLAMVLVCLAACQSGAPANTPDSNTGTSNPSSQQGSSQQDDKPAYYKIAYIGPFTGNSAQYGETHKRALDFAINEINEAGGVDGVPFKIEYFDDKNDAKETVSVANKVVLDDELVACFGPFSSTCAIAAAPVFNKAKIAQICPSASHPDFCKQGDYQTSGSMTQYIQQAFFAEYIYDVMGIKTASLICLNDDTGNITAEVFTEKYEERGGKVLMIEMYQSGTVDFTPLLSKVKASNPEIFYPYGTYADCAQMAIQARKLDITVPIISHGSMVKQEFIDVGGDAVEGFICLTPYDPDFEKEDYQAFLAKYKETYPGYSCDSHTLALYDEMYMLKKAIEDNGPDREKINAFMRNVKDWDGILATYSVTDGEPNKPLFAVAVNNGKFTSYKPE